MNMFRKIDIKDVERNVLGWLEYRKYKLPLFIFTLFMLWILSRAPYINLFFTSYFFILTTVVLAPFILNIDARLFFVSSVVLLLVAFFAWLIDRDTAEKLAEYIFIILLSGILRTMFSADEEDKIDEDNNQRK